MLLVLGTGGGAMAVEVLRDNDGDALGEAAGGPLFRGDRGRVLMSGDMLFDSDVRIPDM